MAIIRNRKNIHEVSVPLEVLLDANLSWRAKGIYAYVYSRPPNWEVHIKHLITQSTEGRDAVYSGISELESRGYLIKVQSKTISGHWNAVDYILVDLRDRGESQANDRPDIRPLTDLPYTENQEAAPKASHYYISNKEDKKKEAKASKKKATTRKRAAPLEVLWDGSDMQIPEELLRKWEQAFQGMDVQQHIREAEAWLLQSGRTYKSYATFLFNWLKRNYVEPAKQNLVKVPKADTDPRRVASNEDWKFV